MTELGQYVELGGAIEVCDFKTELDVTQEVLFALIKARQGERPLGSVAEMKAIIKNFGSISNMIKGVKWIPEFKAR